MKLQEFFESARTWKGTPFHHQESVKGVGADCVGFPKGILREAGYDTSMIPIDYGRFSNEDQLEKVLTSIPYLEKSESLVFVPGNLVLVLVYNVPQHFGIVTDKGWIHSHHKWGVCETEMGRWATRTHSVWKLNILEEC